MKSKKYIFINGPIVRIGGSQLYVLRKMEWLRREGWSVVVFSVEHGDVRIKEFDDFRRNVHPFLSVPIQFFSGYRRDKLLNMLVEEIGTADEYVIQSHNLNLATWGEALAEKLCAKHIVHLLLEEIVCRHNVTSALLRFKKEQGLLFTIKKQVFDRFFGENTENEQCVLFATGCSLGNVISGECSQLRVVERGDYNILIAGRLEKPYIPHAFVGVSEFAARHKKSMISLIVLGSSVNHETVYRLKKLVAGRNNIKVYFVGEIFPVPDALLKAVDVCVASAGCATMVGTSRLTLCISVDAKDYCAIGVYGITTWNPLYRDGEPIVAIADMLEDVLVKKKYSISKVQLPANMRLDFSKHAELINKPFNGAYFNFNACNLNSFERLMRIVVGIFGWRGYMVGVRGYRLIRRICSNKGSFNR